MAPAGRGAPFAEISVVVEVIVLDGGTWVFTVVSGLSVRGRLVFYLWFAWVRLPGGVAPGWGSS
ncbi:hypothetical protein GCM10010495_77600 [Kitasatospora herbaricolor]|nr:hypothetical protein GCM10010495_77600 [Kitasatospora herbaricolor]